MLACPCKNANSLAVVFVTKACRAGDPPCASSPRRWRPEHSRRQSRPHAAQPPPRDARSARPHLQEVGMRDTSASWCDVRSSSARAEACKAPACWNPREAVRRIQHDQPLVPRRGASVHLQGIAIREPTAHKGCEMQPCVQRLHPLRAGPKQCTRMHAAHVPVHTCSSSRVRGRTRAHARASARTRARTHTHTHHNYTTKHTHTQTNV